MPRSLVVSGVVVFAFAAGCSRQPCESGEEAKGPRVRLDVSLGTCNAAPTPVINVQPNPQKHAPVAIDALESDDANGDELTYEWSLVPPEGSQSAIAEPSQRETSFVPDVMGSYTLTLSASDGELTGSAEAVISVKNQLPAANAGLDVRTEVGAPVTLDGSLSTDPEGDLLTFAWSIAERPGGSAELGGAASAQATLTPDVQGPWVVSLRVHDGEGESVEDTVRVLAGISSSEPIANAGTDRSATLGDLVQLDGSASSDDDGDPLSYAWEITTRPSFSAALLTDASTRRPSFIPDRLGVYVVQLTVSDGYYRDTDTVAIDASRLQSSATFDPSQIYLFGTLFEGAAGFDVFCNVLSPDRPHAGFQADSLWRPQSITPDGHLVYAHQLTSEVLRYVPEDLSYFQDDWLYPELAWTNDVVIPTPPCLNTDENVDPILGLLHHPVTGAMFHTCESREGEWFDSTGSSIPICTGTPLAIAEDGSMLCGPSLVAIVEGLRTLDASGVEHLVTGTPPELGYWVVRAKPGGGFWIVGDTREHDVPLQRWSLASDGSVVLDGTYAAPPEGFLITSDTVQGWGELDGEGNFYRWGHFNIDEDVVVRYEADFLTSRVVYDEATDPLCRWHGTLLITGP